ncbi:MAG: hypothetical protein ACRELE_00080 [Gemmatimonadales bacterium]
MTLGNSRWIVVAGVGLVLACSSTPGTTGPGPGSFANNPCSPTRTVQLAVAQAALLDCSAGGTTVTLAGNGASYLIVPQFPTNQVANQQVSYTLATGSLAASLASSQRAAAMRTAASAVPGGSMPARRPRERQLGFESAIFSRPHTGALLPVRSPGAALSSPPTLGSTQTFQVLSNFAASTWTTVTAQLAFVGTNVLLYLDVAAPADGFTPTQLTAFGQLFDQTMYGIDLAAFGQPSDVDANGHVIMLMSPIVNADTPRANCASQGFVVGFFDPEDFTNGVNSNHGEIFYSVVPDSAGIVSCAHTVAQVGLDLPATFLHELQHLINYSQHVVVNGGNPLSSWMDEGLSIVAEELGSRYYEDKCPSPACRTDPAQIFPDSSQGFVNGFLYDSYQYALLPDTASLTLHNDSENGFSWRGGDWILMRYLGDRFGDGFFQQVERGPSDGLNAISSATGQAFPLLFADFGTALYTDSFPGLPRATAPAVDRFVSRNLRQLWARLFVTSGPSTSFPRSMPLQLSSVTSDTSTFVMNPGTMSYWRLDTPATSGTVSIRFATPGGNRFSSALHPQLAILRLPPGQ